MSTPFVDKLRSGGEPIRLEVSGDDVLHLRVQSAELWTSVRVTASPWQLVGSVKAAALEVLYPEGVPPGDFVVKLHGFEVLHEDASLAFVGVRNGSTLLVTQRRRRPVR